MPVPVKFTQKQGRGSWRSALRVWCSLPVWFGWRGIELQSRLPTWGFFCRVRSAAMVVSVVSSGAVHREVRRSLRLCRWAWVRAVVSWPARP